MATTDRTSATFGERLRRVRVERGLTQEDLAHRTDMHASNIGRMERGDSNPSLSTMERLARALEVELGVLLTGIPIGLERRMPDETP
ncbi:MAG: helix-turn-helix transcriptional regulator [Microbacteriaceae bacterium]|nr:helix-turn-helix transcriptional regulator [Microbacteriaceae bacterium]MCL2794176.1 helix-turn-helix transcriptional regulator [Microbacteriaceae bacterium]